MPTLYRGGKVFDGTGRLLDGHGVLVEGARIARVAPLAEFAGWADDLAGGSEDSIGEGLHHLFAGDAFFSFVEIEDGQEFAGHKSGCGVKTKKRESLPAFLRMGTLMVF
jgi:hypothetical protein